MAEYKCRECDWTSEVWTSEKDPKTFCPECGGIALLVNYTRTTPTEPGWYWIRHHIEDEPVIVMVYRYRDTLGENHLRIKQVDDITYHSVECWGGEWSARIEPPE